MYKYLIVTVVALFSLASARPFLQQEANFFGIPNLEALSTEWFMQSSDSSSLGFDYPVDIEVLKIAPSDYRVVILNADSPNFYVFRLDQVNGLAYNDISLSDDSVDHCAFAKSMCLVQQGLYFNPAVDRIAVAFEYGATIGIYEFDHWENKFSRGGMCGT
ncbi:hypothetical protein HZB60_08450 [candidate division KSB1 bacterium]|nr:hypothetical protein [candidate division KSB1 bacterium]